MTVDEIAVWWKSATQEERKEFAAELEQQLTEADKEEIYLMLVDSAGGEEELLQIIREVNRKASLS